MSTAARQVVLKFQKRLDEAVHHHGELLHAVHNHKRQAALESLLAEQFAFTTTVLWEVFLSNVLIAYVSDDPSAFLADLRTRLTESVKGRFGAAAAKCVSLVPPAVIQPHRIPEWLDPKEWNISVSSAAKLASKANQLLPATAAKRFTLSGEDAALFDYTIALRNYLAHRSSGAKSSLKATVSALTGANAVLNAPPSRINLYLKSVVASGDTRAVVLARRLRDLAAVLG